MRRTVLGQDGMVNSVFRGNMGLLILFLGQYGMHGLVLEQDGKVDFV